MSRSPGLVGRGALASVAVLAVGFAVLVPTGTASAAIRSGRRPNIVFVLADDLDSSELRYMPVAEHLVGAKGASFQDFFVSDSLCCPSRATILRGQYAHNTGVHQNGGPHGGFGAAYRSGLQDDTIATRLHDVGYRTGLFGKYLNRYPGNAGARYVPPGWDTWASPVGGQPYFQYRYVLNVNGSPRRFGSAPADYGTDVYMRMARRFVRGAAAREQPFFAYVAPFAPHWPAIPAPEDLDKFGDAAAPRDAAYDMEDVTGMPEYIQDSPRFTSDEQGAIDRLYRRRIRSLQAIDRGVGRLVDTLRSTHELSRTYFVFTSDNGYHLGQHRLPAGKKTPYDTDTHVPFLVRGPSVPAGSDVAALSGNVDIAPTFAAIAGTSPPAASDGRSLLALLRRGSSPAPDGWRDAYLLEHWVDRPPSATRSQPNTVEPVDPDEGGDVEPVDGAGVAEPPFDHPATLRGPFRLDDRTVFRGRHIAIPRYEGLRTGRYLYVEYRTGERELYDTVVDPDEIHNLAGSEPALVRTLGAGLRELRHCRGQGCRAPVGVSGVAESRETG